MLFRRWRRALVCRDAVAVMTSYLDGTLGGTDRARLEQHLAGCPHCSEYLAQLRVVIDTCGHVEPDELDERMLDELVDLYREWRRA